VTPADGTPPLLSAEGLPIAAAVRISRSAPVAAIAPGLMEGYAAWRRGDLAGAEQAYRAVLKERPTERDALLGLAGVAVARGQTREAVRLYEAVLRLNPRDSVASAGLHLLQGGDGPGLDTATLEVMLDEEPAAAHLHFALGNHHARAQRWAEAQAAYFEAWRLEVDNPDYAFNLAVALDQIGQARAATEYYQRALRNAAATGRRYNFNRAAVEARLASLGGKARS
jgi:tetratricopeptide (TPR) repeat protein